MTPDNTKASEAMSAMDRICARQYAARPDVIDVHDYCAIMEDHAAAAVAREREQAAVLREERDDARDLYTETEIKHGAALSRAEQAEARLAEVTKEREDASRARDAWVAELKRERAKAERERDEARAENARLVEALTPSGATKAAYSGEVKNGWKGGDDLVAWTATKDVMALIRKRALANGPSAGAGGAT